MIQPNELRLGNYFHPMNRKEGPHIPANGIFMYVVEIGLFGVKAVHHDEIPAQVEPWLEFRLSDLAPIPITDVIMGKCGFEKIDKPQLGGHIYAFRKWLPHRSWIDFNPWYQVIFENGHACPKYLHQLQNVFYFLTGEELIIKL